MEELSLDTINKAWGEARKLGKKLTDIVVGEREMEIIRSWAFFPPVKNNREAGVFKEEILGISIHKIGKESHWETFNLAFDYLPYLSDSEERQTEIDFEIIRDERRMLKLIKENPIL